MIDGKVSGGMQYACLCVDMCCVSDCVVKGLATKGTVACF